jgi:hypothetical protein
VLGAHFFEHLFTQELVGKVQNVGNQKADKERRENAQNELERHPEPIEVEYEKDEKNRERHNDQHIFERQQVFLQDDPSLKQRHLRAFGQSGENSDGSQRFNDCLSNFGFYLQILDRELFACLLALLRQRFGSGAADACK